MWVQGFKVPEISLHPFCNVSSSFDRMGESCAWHTYQWDCDLQGTCPERRRKTLRRHWRLARRKCGSAWATCAAVSRDEAARNRTEDPSEPGGQPHGSGGGAAPSSCPGHTPVQPETSRQEFDHVPLGFGNSVGLRRRRDSARLPQSPPLQPTTHRPWLTAVQVALLLLAGCVERQPGPKNVTKRSAQGGGKAGIASSSAVCFRKSRLAQGAPQDRILYAL